MVAARSTPMIIGPIQALFFSIVTSMAKSAEQLFGIPDINPPFVRASETSLPPGSRSEISPKTDRITAVESPIDALSYYSLFGSRGESLAVVSCAGATVPRELMLRAYDEHKAFVVALDNDPAGQRGRQKAREETLNWAGFRLSSDCPERKDWNDDLIASPSASALPSSAKLASLRL